MIIENAKYTKDNITEENSAINCIADGNYFSVPLVVGNRHYDAILVWAAIDGNSIADAD